ncbi:YebC/PmpR family DNA-binding transcriptional regulator [Alphaproteobacteria bacterium]|nr:YebC/PmpR family DNA-binding transcriptional regulator [Alphaproteobacteria bacterium]
MAGHSKFKNIMHRKGAQDARRAKKFARLTKELQVAVRGGIDPASNPRLRSALSACRAVNMPKDNIERVIKKAESGENSNLEEIRYEGYAPGGVALIVDAVTDNRNRTAAEVRSSFTKFGGNLGETGSVSFMFNNVGQIVYQKNVKNDDEIFEIAIDVGADDVSSDEINHEIITSVNDFNNVRDKLEDLLGTPQQAEIIWQPENYVQIDDEKRAISILKLLDTLDNCEDVQGIFGNFDINEDIIKKIDL